MPGDATADLGPFAADVGVSDDRRLDIGQIIDAHLRATGMGVDGAARLQSLGRCDVLTCG